MGPKVIPRSALEGNFSSSNDGKIQKKRKPRAKKINNLSADEVRKNHVVSEKRRRELVRAIYDDLVDIIPDLRPTENRSELIIYLKTMNYLKWIYKRNKYLRDQLEKKYSSSDQKTLIPEYLTWELSQSFSPQDDQESSK